VLKGRGTSGKLTPKKLGHNGDQITWMLAQPAELFVVQHIGEVATAISRQLEDAIVARRTRGYPHAIGSIWDGVDLARLLVAHELLDPHTGMPQMVAPRR
jgi:hypothetical protein